MTEQNMQDCLERLERKTKHLEKCLKIAIAGSVIATSAFLLSFTSFDRADQASGVDTLRVRKLVILDENNHERIVIAAPLPDPMINGRVMRRRTVATAGIQFKDPNGTERGGIVTLADSSFVVGIDDENGRERAHLYYLPKRGSGVYLQSATSNETVSLIIPAKGASPNLEISDAKGKKTLFIPVEKK
jgi:hypothetical protein